MLSDDEFRAFMKTLGARIKQIRKEKKLSMFHIMMSTGYYDAQWRKYEAGGSLTFLSLLKVVLALDVSLVELLDGLGQWPRCSVADIQKHNGIDPESDTEPTLEPAAQLDEDAKPKRKRRALRPAVENTAERIRNEVLLANAPPPARSTPGKAKGRVGGTKSGDTPPRTGRAG